MKLMKLMQFEDITQEQWEDFITVYLEAMGKPADKLTYADKMRLDDGLRKMVQMQGVPDINAFKFEWESELINIFNNSMKIEVSATHRTKHYYVFYLDNGLEK